MMGKIKEFIKGLFKREEYDMDCYEAMGSMMINAMRMRQIIEEYSTQIAGDRKKSPVIFIGRLTLGKQQN